MMMFNFSGLIATADFEIDDHEVHAALLLKITELYVTVREFSMASGLLEQYEKINTMNKKLCRELHDAS